MQRGLGGVCGVLFLSANHHSLVVYQNNVFLNTHSCSSANDADGSAPSAEQYYTAFLYERFDPQSGKGLTHFCQGWYHRAPFTLTEDLFCLQEA
ncbi:hypothetical protein EKTHUN627_16620 [Enterobacter kobei]|nr:hypothetical protein EKTHUN627_16620 [Enterobacter kobei]GJA00056.1 hypothetical protein ECV0102_04040 [Enterobacter cloacae]